MEALEKYKAIFKEVFSADEAALGEAFTSSATPAWDSIAHMTLITRLEDEFDIMMDTDDILALTSFNEGMSILNKYGVEL